MDKGFNEEASAKEKTETQSSFEEVQPQRHRSALIDGERKKYKSVLCDQTAFFTGKNNYEETTEIGGDLVRQNSFHRPFIDITESRTAKERKIKRLTQESEEDAVTLSRKNVDREERPNEGRAVFFSDTRTFTKEEGEPFHNLNLDTGSNSVLNSYRYVVGNDEVPSDAEERDETHLDTSSHEPYAGEIMETDAPLPREKVQAIVDQMTRSFATEATARAPSNASNSNEDETSTRMNVHGSDGYSCPGIVSRNDSKSHHSKDDEKGRKERIEEDVDYLFGLEAPQAYPCHSTQNLDCDSPSLTSVVQSLLSPHFLQCIYLGARLTLFCAFPSFMLTEYHTTASFFAAGPLMTIMAALAVREPVCLGMQCMMLICGFQGGLSMVVFGAIMNAINTFHNTSGWWCALLAGPLFFSLFGDLVSKRLLMMLAVIAMLSQYSEGGTAITFPMRFGRDIFFGHVFGLLPVLLPYPIFCYKLTNDALLASHKLHGAILGNVLKSFWAPALIDAKVAQSQVKFDDIRVLDEKIKKLIHLCRYEPVEFNYDNFLRKERLEFLQRLRVMLYAMAAAAAQRIDETLLFTIPPSRKELIEFRATMRTASTELAREIIAVLFGVGNLISPEDMVKHSNIEAMCNKAQIMSDLIEQKRAEMFFVQKLNKDESNYLLRTFVFCSCLVDMAHEVERLDERYKHFDPSVYPSLFRRAYDFFFYEMWRDFWAELPKRITFATVRDVRMWKDGVKYTLGFAVVTAFTINYDPSNTYYFGMAILVRLAQQTASETIFIGISRIAGLAIGCACSYITYVHTHNFSERLLLTMTWEFIALSFAFHPLYFQVSQYVAVIIIAALKLSENPKQLLSRITDNVFALISFFIICIVIFPLDPIRVLWNTRTKLFITSNKMEQNLVALISAPITWSGSEVQFLLEEVRRDVGACHKLISEYTTWMGKCASQPTLRAGTYPQAAMPKVLTVMANLLGLQESLLACLARLHRPREEGTNLTLIRDVMQLIRPFVFDLGKLYQLYLQQLIDSTEDPLRWSLEDTTRLLWKGHLACRSLRHVTGNIQRNFFAAARQVSQSDKRQLNVYLTSTALDEALQRDIHPDILANAANKETFDRLFAMSFHMNESMGNNMISREDLHMFNSITIVAELQLKLLEDLLFPMIEVHEFEKTRVSSSYKFW